MIIIFSVVASALLASIVFLVIRLIGKYHALADLRKLPGPRPSIFFGNAWQLPSNPEGMFKQVLQWADEHWKEGVFCLWLGPLYPYVLTFKPEFAEILLDSSKHLTKSNDYSYMIPWLGTGLLISEGSKWRTRRKLITPTFHFRILNDFLQVFEEQAAILVTRLEKHVGKGVFNLMPFISLCTLDIICITSMDSSPNAQENNDSPYVNAVLRMSKLVHKRQRSPWLWNDVIYSFTPSGREHDKCLRILHDFTNKVIDERIADRAAKNNISQKEKEVGETSKEEDVFKRQKRLAFLDLLLEAYDKGEISREGVREEVDTFMFEGHDTTAAGILFALYLLGRHPEIQQQVQEEVDLFFDSRPETLSVDDLKDLRYLECVIKEAQRIFPSVPHFARTTTEDCQLGEFFAPKGTTVGVSPMALHRNPEIWPAPLQFDPDRFLPENSQGRHPFAFLPFSAGPRNCIGQRFALMEEKIVLSHVLRSFNVESTQTFDELLTCAELITRPKEGLFVTLGKRQ
ncbi:Cytochrome P450 4V2 [Porites harrisoni]